MKIAVCFYGQLRTAKYAERNLKHYFGELINSIDFFMHTWDVKMDRPLNMLRTTFNEPVKIDNKLVDEYKHIYSPVDFMCEDQIKLRQVLEKAYGIPGRKTISELAFPYHSFYRAIQFKKQHEAIHKFTYDVVIKLRPDIIFPPDRTLQQDITEFLQDPSKIYICYHDDVFHIATSKNMDIAADFYVNNDVLYSGHGLPFDAFTEYLETHKVPMTKMSDCRFTVMRHELTHLDPIAQYHEACYLNSVLYSEIFYHLRYSWKWWYNPRNIRWKEDMYAAMERMLHTEDLEIMIKNHLIDI